MNLPAVVLAGDGKASKKVRDRSKAFLSLRGKPLLAHVLSTVLRTPEVGRVACVGPADAIADLVHRYLRDREDRITVVDQGPSFLSNALAGYRAVTGEGNDDPALFVPCDIPLVVPDEISEFLDAADTERCDYVIGLTEERVLARFYPTQNLPGIRMSYFHLRDGLFRQNNLHVGRPLRADRIRFVETMYEARYQKEWGNVIRIASALLFSRIGVLGAIRTILRLQRAMRRADRGKTDARYRRIVRRLRLPDVEKRIGRILGLRLGTAVTSYGGAALDVDNDSAIAAAEARYEEWISYQQGRKPAVADA